MVTRVFLALNALVWLPYGLWCFAQPGFLGGDAGVSAASLTGTVELRAMYGGLQAAFGVLALAALRRPDLRVPALVALAFATAGLFAGRLGGVVLGGGVSGYTGFALVFEAATAAFAVWLLRREAAPA